MDTQKHRHFVALPVAALLIAALTASTHFVSASVTASDAGGTRLVASEDSVSFHDVQGYSGTVDVGGELRILADGTVSLIRGSATITTVGTARIVVNGVQATVNTVQGSVFVTSDANGVSVVPLSVPAVVTVNAQTLFVPLSRQAYIGTSGEFGLSPVVQSWLAAKQADLRESSAKATIFTTDSSLPLLSAFAIVVDRRNTPQSVEQALQTMHDASSPSTALGFALTLTERGTIVEHPLADGSAQAWVAFSSSAITADPMHAMELLRSAQRFIRALDAAGYPANAIVWRDALKQVSRLALSLLPASSRQQLVTLLATLDADRPTRPQVAESASSAAPAITLSDRERAALEAFARSAVLENSGMITAQSSFEAASHNTVHIRAVYFATPQGDSSFDFVLNIETLGASAITRDGKLLPNSMLLKDF